MVFYFFKHLNSNFLCNMVLFSCQFLYLLLYQYALDRLKMMCEETLAYNLSVDTVCNVLILADLHNAQNLKSIAIDFTNRYVLFLFFSTHRKL